MPRRGKKTAIVTPGYFKPAVPSDTQEVVLLYLVAARAVCARPAALDEVQERLARVTQRLVPPESLAATECDRLWGTFVRVASSTKETLRQEAGKALYRDLESMGQRLDLPPNVSWSKLPDGVDDPNAKEVSAESQGQNLEGVRSHAKDRLAGHEKDPIKTATIVETLLREMEPNLLEEAFLAMVGQGSFGRSECNMVLQHLASTDEITDEHEALVEVLGRLAAWLAAEMS